MPVKLSKQLTDRIKLILLNHPATRDSDEYLAVKVWVEEFPELKQSTFKDFVILFRTGETSSYESISRARRKLQEHFPELRGNNYKERQAKTEKIKQELKENHFKQS